MDSPFDSTSADWDALASYLSGEATPEQRQVVETWIATHPNESSVLATYQQVWSARRPDCPSAYQADAGWAAVLARIEATDAPSQASSAVRHPQVRKVPGAIGAARPWWRTAAAMGVAAAVGLAVMIGIGVQYRSRNTPRAIGATYQTASGERASITLADGSRVTLAPESELVLDAQFGTRSRTLALRGEAYFEVATASAAPFVVQTGSLQTRVLGTAFDVSHYARDSVRVAVLSGKVAVSSQYKTTVVAAGTVARVTDSSAVVALPRDLDAYTAWTRGRLVFHDVPAREMLSVVGRWYGYTFQLPDTVLAAQRVTISFDVGEPKKMIEAIEALLQVTVRVTGTNATLRPRQSSTKHPAPTRRDDDGLSTTHREIGK